LLGQKADPISAQVVHREGNFDRTTAAAPSGFWRA
jgi:hypothetical protein